MVGLGIAIFVCIWAAVWAGIIYELKNAPEMDDYGNIIKDNEENIEK